MFKENIILNNQKKCWNLSWKEKIRFDNKIYTKLIKMALYLKTDKFFLIYWPRENEPDTIALIDELLNLKKNVCLLSVNKKGLRRIVQITDINFPFEWLKNMKIPTGNNLKMVYPNQIACVILPTIAFDKNNKNIIYDSNKPFIDFLNIKNIISIAVGYSFCMTDILSSCNTAKLNFIITEKD